MHVPQATIVGRERELGVARQFLTDAAIHGPASLVLEGVAGIGKTAIWATAVRTLAPLVSPSESAVAVRLTPRSRSRDWVICSRVWTAQ